MKSPESFPNRPPQKGGWLAFLAWVLAIVLIWLVVLPWLGSLSPVRAKIDREKASGVNPDAMFYTELEAMDAILKRLQK